MIEAELHGKVPSEVEDVEDVLTSTVFEVLQYVPPQIFWKELLRRAVSLGGKSFDEKCEEQGADVTKYDRLRICFWAFHEKYGEPDLLLVFSGGEQEALCFVIEAKLWAAKSGTGEQDQLVRYLLALRDSAWLTPVTGFRHLILPGLIYLTPQTSMLELSDSVQHASPDLDAENNLFSLQWQDILEVAQEVSRIPGELPYTMLARIAKFLAHRGLAYFRGFIPLPIQDFSSLELGFYQPTELAFCGFDEMAFETPAPAEIGSHSLVRLHTFNGFTDVPFENVVIAEVTFYGGRK